VSGSGLGLLVICFFFGLAGGTVGRIKGSSFAIWFLISACVPFIGLLTAVLYRFEDRELRRQCPRCRRVVRLHDAVCMTCGTELEFPNVALASPSDLRLRGVDAGKT
jgi:peptidoglycan/LPS O-acetylase OafA/YrhL